MSEVRNRQAGLADQLERKGKDLQKRTANIDKVLNDRSKISAENAQKIRSTREKAIREMQESARKLRQEIQKAKESNDSQPAR